MKTTFTRLAFATLLLSPFTAMAENYTLDPNHSTIIWNAGHFGFSNPTGMLPMVEGMVQLDSKHPEASAVNVTIHTDKLVTGLPKFDEHLKSPDFLDAKKYPTATFKSNRVIVTGTNSANVEGDLTIRGITKPTTLNVVLNKIGPQPIGNAKTAGFSATAVIKRSDYGMTYALPLVTDEVQIRIEAEGNVAANAEPIKPKAKHRG